MRLTQMTGKIWVGRIKSTISRTSAYFGYINFGVLLLTFYSVSGYKYAPLWLFFFGAIVTVILIGAIDFFLVLPSEQAFNNQQAARHQNPIYEKLKEIQEVVDK